MTPPQRGNQRSNKPPGSFHRYQAAFSEAILVAFSSPLAFLCHLQRLHANLLHLQLTPPWEGNPLADKETAPSDTQARSAPNSAIDFCSPPRHTPALPHLPGPVPVLQASSRIMAVADQSAHKMPAGAWDKILLGHEA